MKTITCDGCGKAIDKSTVQIRGLKHFNGEQVEVLLSIRKASSDLKTVEPHSDICIGCFFELVNMLDSRRQAMAA